MSATGTVRFIGWNTAVFVIVAAMFHGDSARAEKYSEPAEAPANFLTLHQLDAYLELKGDLTYSSIDTARREAFGPNHRQRNREWRFEERIGLRLGGVVIDQHFLTFDGEFSLALTQDRYHEEFDAVHRTDRDNGYLTQYDLRANFLPGKRISSSVYGLRQDDRINRRFQSTLDRRRTGFGVSVHHNHQRFPWELTYDYIETDRTGNRNQLDDEHFTESTLHYGGEWVVSGHNRFKFDYEHNKTKQEYQGSIEPFETTRDLLKLEHQLEFGPDQGHSLRTLIHWQEESGDFARDFFEIGPQLTLKHSESLQTIYRYQFNRERYEGLDVETQRADFQLIHQVYSNLTTTLSVFGLYEDVEDDINTTQYGASVDMQYNRRNPYGHLYANLALAYDTEEISGDNGIRIILDEAQTFREPVAITLRNRNAIFGTVVVTDTTNRRIYRAGVDYFVFAQGNAVRLTRIRTGRIVDGDTVLVDYQVRTPARGQLDTVRVDFSIEQRFTSGLTPYYRLSYRNQEDDVTTGFLRRADRTDHHRFGVNYEAKRFSLGAEYEIFDDTVEPFDAFHLRGMVHIMQSPDHNVDASTRVSRLFFEDAMFDRDVTMIDVEIDHRWRLSDSLNTVERLAYRYQDDSVEGITTGWDLVAGFEYVLGDLSGELTFEYDRLDLPGSEEDDFGIYFRLRRDFPNVLVQR